MKDTGALGSTGASEVGQIMTDACDARSEAPRTDLSGEVRPMTLMKAKLHMQKVAAGDAIEIVVSGDQEIWPYRVIIPGTG